MKSKEKYLSKRKKAVGEMAKPYEDVIDRQIDTQYALNGYVVVKPRHFEEAKLQPLEDAKDKEMINYLSDRYEVGHWDTTWINDENDGLYFELR